MPDHASGELVPIMVCDGVLEVVADVVVGPLASRYRGSVGKDSGDDKWMEGVVVVGTDGVEAC